MTNKGWYNDSKRHSLASRGIPTRTQRLGVRNPNMARYGKNNGRWKNGSSKTYYRKVAGATLNDGTIVHHKDGNKFNSKKSNLERIHPTRNLTARGIHSQQHPEKGYTDTPRVFVRWTNTMLNQTGRDWNNWKFTTSENKRKLSYGEMQKEILMSPPQQITAYHKGKEYDRLKLN